MSAKRAKTFKKGDKVRLTKAVRRTMRVGAARPFGGVGEVVRVDHPGYPRVTVLFPKSRSLNCSPKDLERA